MMHPDIARTLVDQRREQLARCSAESGRRRDVPARPRRLGCVPRWRVSWSRTILSPAAEPGTAGTGRSDRPGKRGSSLVIIISAYR
jgi:hypothetical protein